METAVFNLRVDADLGAKVKEQAKRMNISANRLLINAINTYLREEKAREWRESFEAMANDPESTDVEFAFEAQREVVLAD